MVRIMELDNLNVVIILILQLLIFIPFTDLDFDLLKLPKQNPSGLFALFALEIQRESPNNSLLTRVYNV